MVEIHLIEQFLAVAREGSLQKAAQALHLSQPSLSRSMAQIEAELGVRLFERSRNRLQPNANGRKAIELFESLLESYDGTVQALRFFSCLENCRSIGCCAPTPMLDLRRQLDALHLDESWQILLEGECQQLVDDLLSYQIAGAILPENMNLPGCHAYPLFEEELVISLPHSHPLCSQDALGFSDLDGISLLCLEDVGFWKPLIESWFPHSRIYFQSDYDALRELSELSSLPAIKSSRRIEYEGLPASRIMRPFKPGLTRKKFYLFVQDNSPLVRLIPQLSLGESPRSRSDRQ